MRRIVIGTRGSALALKQSEIVQEKLLTTHPELSIALKIIKTEGDNNSAPIPLDVVGKGWFTKEIEHELEENHIDLAVHSLKDLPEEMPNGLIIGAFLNREDSRDCLVTKHNVSLNQLPSHAIIGTDSIRRRVQLEKLRSDIEVRSIRGNVPTRIKKMEEGEYDAVVLAVAGLKRLGLQNKISEYFEIDTMTPAPGQGILAVQTRSTDLELMGFLHEIDEKEVRAIAEIERYFSQAVGGGCKQPVGVYTTCNDGVVVITAMVASKGGDSKIFRSTLSGNLSDGTLLAKQLAEQMRTHLHD